MPFIKSNLIISTIKDMMIQPISSMYNSISEPLQKRMAFFIYFSKFKSGRFFILMTQCEIARQLVISRNSVQTIQKTFTIGRVLSSKKTRTPQKLDKIYKRKIVNLHRQSKINNHTAEE